MTELTEAGRRVADMPAFPTNPEAERSELRPGRAVNYAPENRYALGHPGPTFFQQAALELMTAYRAGRHGDLSGDCWRAFLAGNALTDATALCNALGALQEGGSE